LIINQVIIDYCSLIDFIFYIVLYFIVFYFIYFILYFSSALQTLYLIFIFIRIVRWIP